MTSSRCCHCDRRPYSSGRGGHRMCCKCGSGSQGCPAEIRKIRKAINLHRPTYFSILPSETRRKSKFIPNKERVKERPLAQSDPDANGHCIASLRVAFLLFSIDLFPSQRSCSGLVQTIEINQIREGKKASASRSAVIPGGIHFL